MWSEINASSAAQQAAKFQLESTQEAKSRASRHWLPTVYLDAKTYQTNDPGASFFGLIQQRSLQTTDFNANSINHPDAAVYTRGALGVNLALYEGGMKSAQVDMLKHSEVAEENIYAQTRLNQYAQVGVIYGQLGVLEKKQDQLTYLKAQVEKLLKNYQLGSRSNPVGHSGLLGMKSLANRIEGLLIQFQAQSQS
ncbi:MAG: TolC family protein, partial [Bdellovibrionales bacterium]|nr:TolC family protein [Bdellovibrionales bacterium]